MFDYLIGRLVERHPTYIVIENNGVAYKILIPLSSYEKLPPDGEIKIYTCLHLQAGLSSNSTESALRLYGFLSLEERRLFQLLGTVQRVGPTVALRILSSSSVKEFCQAILTDNLKYLAQIRGVGPKTAQRLLVELKEPLSKWQLLPLPCEGKQKESPRQADITGAILALVSLGYSRLSAEQAVKKALKQMPPDFITEDLVKKALQDV